MAQVRNGFFFFFYPLQTLVRSISCLGILYYRHAYSDFSLHLQATQQGVSNSLIYITMLF